jgi:probable H4MPT-linked C1 transfer pathway protein
MPEHLACFPVIGWDIGGAHLKSARLDGRGRLVDVHQLACPLWQGMGHLETACDTVLASLPAEHAFHAVTMSGEMADLFPDRASGVAAIVSAFADRLAKQRRDDEIWLYAGHDGFIAPAAVRRDGAGEALAVASANWLATAAWCAGHLGDGVLVDIGSTTTDLVPFGGGCVKAAGGDDRQRLECGELVYAGIIRTPLMALAAKAPFAGSWRSIMNEHFATTADVFRVLGEMDEIVDLQPAADGGEKTPDASARRLLRMVGEDLRDDEYDSARGLAKWYRGRLLDLVVEGLSLRLSRGDVANDAPLVGAGSGRRLLADLAARMGRGFSQIDTLLGGNQSNAELHLSAGHCAPAVAVARLLQGQSACIRRP